MQKISCIICAYNEGPRIGTVLEAVCQSPMLDEIIVVDDGSSDETSSVAELYTRVRLIRHSNNKGKTAAILTGIATAKNEIVMLLDADLTGLTPGNIASLAEPVLSGKSNMTTSMRQNALSIWHFFGIDILTGDRVLPKELIAANREDISLLPGYGFETYVSKLALENGLDITVVDWNNVRLVSKPKKTGLVSGYMKQARMFLDVFTALSFRETVLLYYRYFFGKTGAQRIIKCHRGAGKTLMRPVHFPSLGTYLRLAESQKDKH